MRSFEARMIEWGLKAPFPQNQLKSREGGGGKVFYYIDARMVMERLDKVVGPENWSTTMSTAGGQTACSLSVNYGAGSGSRSVSSMSVPINPPLPNWITKTDGAGETSFEGEKGQFSDAYKRAAVHFGIGRMLYLDGGHKVTPEMYAEKYPMPEEEK